MDGAFLRNYCLRKKGAIEDLPFGDDVLVIKVLSKMFALVKVENGIDRVNLKCNPALAQELRRKYESIEPGYHMNKQHWNTVYLNGDVPEEEILGMIDHSYDLVVKGLKRAEKEYLSSL